MKGQFGDVRSFVGRCPIGPTEESDHPFAKGQLQSRSIPENKWMETSIDSITDLPLYGESVDSFMVVVHKSTWMTHLVGYSKIVTAAQVAKIIYERNSQIRWNSAIHFDG